ncbi:MAG: hypothetical protein EP330_18575 [Deltaproteobacteria bacterium]|nr:MAG: hypothetical protein EP330_18575 [Deltaproteobacteria bacterium]
MNRRRFLTAALATLALPTVVQAFEGAPTELAAVAAAFRTAADEGRPLLVFVIPDDNGEKWRLGRAFGELINHGDLDVQARLGHAVLVAARREDLATLVPGAIDAKALMFAIDASAVPAAVNPLSTRLVDDPDWGGDMSWEQREKQTDDAIDARIAALSDLVLAALPEPPQRARAIQRFRTEVLAEPVEGSHWARSGGCGTMVEGATRQMAVGCGMGHVNARSARVMYFFEVDA